MASTSTEPVSRFEEALRGHQAAVGERRPGRFRGPVLPLAPRPPGHRTLRGPIPPRSGSAPAVRACWTSPDATPTAGGRPARGPRGLRRQARTGHGRGRARGPRPDGDHAVLHPDLPDRRTRPSSPRSCEAPLVKSFLLQVSAEVLRSFGFEHPMGPSWRGFQDIDPARPDPRAHPRLPRPGRARDDPRAGAARHARAGGPHDQGLRRRRPAGAQDPGLRRHGRPRRTPRRRRRTCATPRTN